MNKKGQYALSGPGTALLGWLSPLLKLFGTVIIAIGLYYIFRSPAISWTSKATTVLVLFIIYKVFR